MVSQILMWKKTRHAQIQWEIFRILKRSYVNVPYFRPYFLGIFPGTPNSNGLISGYVNSLLLKMTVEIVDFPKWWFSIVFCMFTRGYHQSSDKAICILGGLWLWYTAFSDKTDKTHMVMGQNDPYQKLLWIFIPPVMVIWPDIHTW